MPSIWMGEGLDTVALLAVVVLPLLSLLYELLSSSSTAPSSKDGEPLLAADAARSHAAADGMHEAACCKGLDGATLISMRSMRDCVGGAVLGAILCGVYLSALPPPLPAPPSLPPAPPPLPLQPPPPLPSSPLPVAPRPSPPPSPTSPLPQPPMPPWAPPSPSTPPPLPPQPPAPPSPPAAPPLNDFIFWLSAAKASFADTGSEASSGPDGAAPLGNSNSYSYDFSMWDEVWLIWGLLAL